MPSDLLGWVVVAWYILSAVGAGIAVALLRRSADRG